MTIHFDLKVLTAKTLFFIQSLTVLMSLLQDAESIFLRVLV